jgi:hypothetical protein
MDKGKKDFKPIGAVAFFVLMILLFVFMWFSIYLVNLFEGR